MPIRARIIRMRIGQATVCFLDINPDAEFSNQLTFSSNVVCINVSGPDVPDLSFIDLPGVWSIGPLFK